MQASVLSCSSRVWPTPWTVACQVPLSLGFSRQEYWSGLPFPPSGDLLDPGIKPKSLTSPALAGRFFTTSATWEALSPTCKSTFSYIFLPPPSFFFLPSLCSPSILPISPLKEMTLFLPESVYLPWIWLWILLLYSGLLHTVPRNAPFIFSHNLPSSIL